MNLKQKAFDLLRYSERFFKTDMIYATKGGSWLFFGQGISFVASLLLAIAFANLIDPEKYGNYKYILSVASVISILTFSGLGTAVMRAVSRKFEGTLAYAFRISLLWSIGIIVISAIGGTYYLLRENEFLGYSFFIIGVTSPLISASALYKPFLLGKKYFKKASIFGMLQNLFPTISVLIALLLNAPLLLLVGIYFSVNAITLLTLYKKTKRLAENSDVDPVANHLGKHLSIMGIVTVIASKLDSLIIFQLLGGAELAIFSLATAMPDIVRGSLKHFTSLAMPKFAEKTKEEMKVAIWSKMKIVFLMTSAITTSYILVAPYAFEILFPEYVESVPYSQVYALTIVASILLASAYFDSQEVVKERYILNVIINGTTIITTVFGIYLFGIWGAVFAKLITRVVGVSLSIFIIRRH